MKPILPFLCALFLLSPAAFAASHHEVVFTGIIYYNGATEKIGTTIVNNTYLIMAYTSAKTLREAAAYDVVVNDVTGEVDVIDKATRVIQHPIVSIDSSNGLAGNGPSTASCGVNNITCGLPGFAPPPTGSEFVLDRYNAGAALISSSASIIVGNGFAIFHGAFTTRPVLYNF